MQLLCNNYYCVFAFALQFFTDQTYKLAQCKYQLMLRWRRFGRHSAILEKHFPQYEVIWTLRSHFQSFSSCRFKSITSTNKTFKCTHDFFFCQNNMYILVLLFRSRWRSWTASLRIVCIGHVDWPCPERRSWQVPRAPSARWRGMMSSFTCSGLFVICTPWKSSTALWMWESDAW